MTDAALYTEPQRTRAPRRVVTLAVVLYCLLAWAALFEAVKLGIGLFQPPAAHFAQSDSEAK